MEGVPGVPRKPVTWQGLSEDDALDLILGVDRAEQPRLQELGQAFLALERIELAAKVILHALHAELGSWKKVAKHLGRPQTTVYNWAHPRQA